MGVDENRVNTVFILGAGASADSGVPLMSNFLDVAEVLWRTNKVASSADDFAAVFEGRSKLQAILSKANLDILNIEDVFAAFEMGKTLATLPGYSGEVKIEKLIQSVKVLISKTIDSTQVCFGQRSDAVKPPYPYWDFGELIKDLKTESTPPHNVSIITFNYDIGCEHGLFSRRLRYSYHLGDEESDQESIPLLKLHGSLNWARDKRGLLIPFRMEEFFTGAPCYEPIQGYGKGRFLMAIGSRLGGCRALAEMKTPVPFIVPPTWNKAGYHREITRVWRKAASVLGTANNIIVSGYSLPKSDAFFRYLYALGTIGKEVLGRFWVFDKEPEDGGVDNRFRELLSRSVLQRYRYFPRPFSEAIGLLSGSLVDSKLGDVALVSKPNT